MGTITVNTDLVEGKLMGNGTSQPSLFWIYQNFFPMYINMTWNMMCEIWLRTFFLMIYSFIFQKSRKKKKVPDQDFYICFLLKNFFFDIWNMIKNLFSLLLIIYFSKIQKKVSWSGIKYLLSSQQIITLKEFINMTWNKTCKWNMRYD